MRSVVLSLALAVTCAMALPLAAAGPNTVKDMVDAGEIMPFEVIQKRVAAQVPGDYVGVEFDAGTRRYRFRFLVDGNVVNVDVDARTGQRLNARKSY